LINADKIHCTHVYLCGIPFKPKFQFEYSIYHNMLSYVNQQFPIQLIMLSPL